MYDIILCDIERNSTPQNHKKKKKNHFGVRLFLLCRTSCVNTRRFNSHGRQYLRRHRPILLLLLLPTRVLWTYMRTPGSESG